MTQQDNNDNIENSIKEWTNTLEQICKRYEQIKDYEIYIESIRIDQYICKIDKRGRWGRRLEHKHFSPFQYSIFILLTDGRSAQKTYQSSYEQAPDQLLTDLIAIAKPKKYQSIATRQNLKLYSLDIWDARYPRLTDDDRKELFEWNISSIRQTGVKLKIQDYTLQEEEHTRLFRSNKNQPNVEKTTLYKLSANLFVGSDKELFQPVMQSHRFADISSHALGINELVKPKSPPKKELSDVSDLLMILSSNITAQIIEKIYPAFDQRLLDEGKSFLSQKKGTRIGAENLHLLDNASIFSGFNSRSFDARGVVPKTLTLINEGIFQDSYLSVEKAKEHQVMPTGHEDFQGKLWPGNLLVHHGRRSQNMVLADRAKALMTSELRKPIKFDLQTGQIHLVANYWLVSSNGVEADIGERTIDCHICDLFQLIFETTNDLDRYDFIDSCSWVLDDCSLLLI